MVRRPDEEDPLLDDHDAEYRGMDEDDEEEAAEEDEEAEEEEGGGVAVEAELIGSLIDDPAAWAGL